MSRITSRVLLDVLKERKRQDKEWGGPEHDDQHDITDWERLINKQWVKAEQARDYLKGREYFVKFTALGAAIIEWLDRGERDRVIDKVAKATKIPSRYLDFPESSKADEDRDTSPEVPSKTMQAEPLKPVGVTVAGETFELMLTDVGMIPKRPKVCEVKLTFLIVEQDEEKFAYEFAAACSDHLYPRMLPLFDIGE